MGRYYVHVVEGEHTLADDSGGEFANVHQAKEHVLACARDLIQSQLQDHSRWNGCDFLITDASGRTLIRLPVTDCLDAQHLTAGTR